MRCTNSDDHLPFELEGCKWNGKNNTIQSTQLAATLRHVVSHNACMFRLLGIYSRCKFLTSIGVMLYPSVNHGVPQRPHGRRASGRKSIHRVPGI